MQIAANLSLLYSGLPPEQRFAAAAADGFRYVEILSPYDEPPGWYAQQLKDHDLELVLINTPVVSPDYPVGVAAQPQAHHHFQNAMEQAAAVCRATGCPAVHVMAGQVDSQYARDDQSAMLQDNLRWATERYPELALHLEALNGADMPGYFYSVPEQVAQELVAIDRPRVGMQFDFYHVAKERLLPAQQLEHYFSLVFHVQIAGAPDRQEPDLQRDGVLAGIKKLDALGYKGYLGLEYRPENSVRQGLTWLQPLLDQNLIVCHRATK